MENLKKFSQKISKILKKNSLEPARTSWNIVKKWFSYVFLTESWFFEWHISLMKKKRNRNKHHLFLTAATPRKKIVLPSTPKIEKTREVPLCITGDLRIFRCKKYSRIYVRKKKISEIVRRKTIFWEIFFRFFESFKRKYFNSIFQILSRARG